MIKNMTDASVMVPLVKEYLEISVKNDDNLVKLTAIIQRLLVSGSKTADTDGMGLTDAERAQLMSEAQELIDKNSVMGLFDVFQHPFRLSQLVIIQG